MIEEQQKLIIRLADHSEHEWGMVEEEAKHSDYERQIEKAIVDLTFTTS